MTKSDSKSNKVFQHLLKGKAFLLLQYSYKLMYSSLLAKLKTATLPESATLMPVDQVNTASTSKMAPDQLELKDLKAQLKEEEASANPFDWLI